MKIGPTDKWRVLALSKGDLLVLLLSRERQLTQSSDHYLAQASYKNQDDEGGGGSTWNR